MIPRTGSTDCIIPSILSISLIFQLFLEIWTKVEWASKKIKKNRVQMGVELAGVNSAHLIGMSSNDLATHSTLAVPIDYFVYKLSISLQNLWIINLNILKSWIEQEMIQILQQAEVEMAKKVEEHTQLVTNKNTVKICFVTLT